MSEYVDGFVIPIPKAGLEKYKAMAETAANVWKDHGALDYRECILEDPDAKGMLPFRTLAAAKEDEVVVFAWITYRSRADRDAVNAKVMQDPRIQESCKEGEAPFDCARMAYGGFETLVHL